MAWKVACGRAFFSSWHSLCFVVRNRSNMKVADIANTELVPVKTENIIQIPLGLLGFEKIQQYVLLATPEEAPFQWLQVLDDPNLAFLVVSPFEVLPDYQPEIAEEDARFLGLAGPHEALLFNVVTLRGAGRATMNLKGPIILNRRTLIGKQVVLVNATDYALQYPLPVTE